MKRNEIISAVILSTFALPSMAHANPMTPVIGIPGIFIALAMESALLTLFVKSYEIRPYRFMLIWYVITSGTFVLMTLFVFGLSWRNIFLDAAGVALVVLVAELLVVLSEAIILRWLLKRAFVLKAEAKEISFPRALLYSLVVNIVSFISGFIMLFLSSSSA